MRHCLQISWAVEEISGDVVGLGSCLCLSSAAAPHCPSECRLGALLFLRWDVKAAMDARGDPVPPPTIVNSMQITDIGGGAGYRPRLVQSGGALVQSKGVYSQLIMKRPDVPSCLTPLLDRRPCRPLPPNLPTPSNATACAAVIWCCWGANPQAGREPSCFQETDGPGPPVFVSGIASFDALTGAWLATVDLVNQTDEPMVEISEQAFFLLEVPTLPQ